MTIGQRAYLEIYDNADRENISVKKECENLEIDRSIINQWRRGVSSPRADILQRMALKGYDVIYILTGAKNNG